MAVVIPLPKLYVNGKFRRTVHPVSVSITENIIPVSTASMLMREGEELPVRSYMELFTPYGSAGMYRLRAPKDGYGDEDTSAELEHMIAEVGDYAVRTEIEEMRPATTAVRTFFGYYNGGLWKLGKYSDLGSDNVAVEVKYDSILTALLSVLQQRTDCMMQFDFTTKPWTVNFVKKGTKVVSQGRLARNVDGAQVTYDEAPLVTRVWYQTWTKDEKGNAVGTWTHKDADTWKTYGNKEKRLDTSFSMTSAEIQRMVNQYLKEHKHPKTSVSIRAAELYRITGEKVDRFVIGDLFRLAIPKYSLTIELNITSITWGNVYDNPEDVIVHLGEEEDTVVTFLHNLDAGDPGVSGTGGGRGAGNSAKKNSLYDTQWHVYEDRIEGFSKQFDEQGNLLKQAGLQLSPDGVLIYANNGPQSLQAKFNLTMDAIETEVINRTDITNTLTSRIRQEANKISMVVEQKDGQNVIKSASIITAINADGSSIRLNADKIHLEGYTKNLAAGSFTGVGIRCGSFSCNSAQFTLGVNVVWKSTIKDGDGNTVNVMKWG